MKRIINSLCVWKLFFTAMTLLLTLNVSAQRTHLEWNKSLEGGFGYSHVYQSLGSDSYGTCMPVDLLNVHLSACGVYFQGAYWVKKTGYDVYGYDETVSTFDFQLGPSWRLKWNETKLTFTPFIGWLFYTVNDTSNNAIGQRQDYGLRKEAFEFGGRLGFAYKQFVIGAFGSNKTCGLSIGVNYDWE